jgi:octaprenyl-diphosphate synthase
MFGKMLRTQLAARLVSSGAVRARSQTVELVCAATEMAHTASLCHDDVIDGGFIRRGQPALWRLTSPSGAVLIGDILLCEAMDVIVDTEGGRYLSLFVAKTREVCQAEAEQELLPRDRLLDEQTCLRLSRAKTGPPFAFVGQVCGGSDRGLSLALAEAGYLIGTAYQLADDLLDVIGSEEEAGKTLGTDSKRRKPTLPLQSQQGRDAARRHIAESCSAALHCLAAWPQARRGVEGFLMHDVQPVLHRLGLPYLFSGEPPK